MFWTCPPFGSQLDGLLRGIGKQVDQRAEESRISNYSLYKAVVGKSGY